MYEYMYIYVYVSDGIIMVTIVTNNFCIYHLNDNLIYVTQRAIMIFQNLTMSFGRNIYCARKTAALRVFRFRIYLRLLLIIYRLHTRTCMCVERVAAYVLTYL